MDPVYISVPDFLSAFGLGRTTAYSLLAAKELHAIKVGTRTLIEVASAKAYFARQAEFAPKAA
jgi:hypothetical protein